MLNVLNLEAAKVHMWKFDLDHKYCFLLTQMTSDFKKCTLSLSGCLIMGTQLTVAYHWPTVALITNIDILEIL